MEARSAENIPAGDGWQYEPKWDGFRCIAFRNGEEIYLQSKAGQPLARYFPDIADAVAKLRAQLSRSAVRFHSMNCNFVYIRRRVGCRSWRKLIQQCTSCSTFSVKVDDRT